MKTLILLLIFFTHTAKALDLPLFPDSETKAASAPFRKSQVAHFRVLVFPHVGLYSIPQGRETAVKSVLVTSDGYCDAYAASLDSNQEWIKSGPLLKHLNKVTLNVTALLGRSGLPSPIYYECNSPFLINRPAPLRSLEYSGSFVATTDGTKVELINIIDPETYIKGVVPAEVEASWPKETLEAQAIAARTYAWWSVLQARLHAAPYDMDDTVFYQAYLGNYKRSPATDSASDETSGQVMRHAGEIIKAYFAADSGGFTEDAVSVFGVNLPYCVAKREVYDLTQTQTAWTKTFTTSEFQNQMLAFHFIPAGISVRNVYLDPSDVDTSGRVMRIHILGSNGKVYLVGGNDFRYRTKIRSNLFQLSFSREGLVINGKGYGHGVGMAQIGALQYSKQFGWNHDQILQFYYTGVTIADD